MPLSDRFARIAGWGMYLPERVLTNAEIERVVDTSDEWIRTRSGILERRVAAPKEATSDLALGAARGALERAGVEPGELDLLVLATATPDYVGMPATASIVQHALG